MSVSLINPLGTRSVCVYVCELQGLDQIRVGCSWVMGVYF